MKVSGDRGVGGGEEEEVEEEEEEEEEDGVTEFSSTKGSPRDHARYPHPLFSEDKPLVLTIAVSSTLAFIFLITTVALSVVVGSSFCRRKRLAGESQTKVADPEVLGASNVMQQDEYYMDNFVANVGVTNDAVSSTDDIVDDEDYYADNTITNNAMGGGDFEDDDEDYYADNIITEH